MAISDYRLLRTAAYVFAGIFIGFGVNGIVRPANALAIFEFPPPASAADRKLVDSLMALYGVRDIFMGAAINAAAYFGDRKALGWILIAGSGVAFVDGAICLNQIGTGQWNHWGYAPMLTLVGSALIGVFDRA